MSLRVLLFDGDPPLASALEQALARVGADVVCQGERSSFMAAAIAKTPDLIVFVYQPSRTEAFSVCLAVRRDPSLARVPTAIVSRHAVEAEFEKHKGTKNRADAYHASVASAEALLLRLREVAPALPAAPPSGPGIDIVEEGFDEDDDARTVVGRIPMEFFASKAASPEPSADSADRPTLEGGDAVIDEPAIDLADPLVVDEALVAFGTMPDANELAAEAPRVPTVPPPIAAPAAPASSGPSSVALRDAEAKVERLEAFLAERDERLGSLRADVDARDRELVELRAAAADSGRQLEELRTKLAVTAKSQGNVSMKEFLDLREQIGKRDREILQIREALTKKDRDLIDERDRSLSLERARAESDEAIADLTRARFESDEARAKLEGDAGRYAERAAAAESAAEEHLASLARERERASMAAEELESTRAENARIAEALSAAKSEAAAAVEAAKRDAEAAVSAARREAEEVILAARRDADASLATSKAEHDAAASAAKAAEGLAEERLIDLRNLGAQKAAVEVELTRLREEHTGLVEAHELERRALADLRVSADAASAGHEAAMAELRADDGAKLAALERDLDASRASEASLRGERDAATMEAQAVAAKLVTAESAWAEAQAALDVAERSATAAATASAEALAGMSAKHEETRARGVALEAEADGIRAERDAFQRNIEERRAAQTRAAAERHATLERARDALAVALAEVDALPLGDAT